MKTITQKYKIKAPVEKVWQALVDPKIINKWGGGPVKMTDEAGAGFKLWGGDIYGKNIKVVENKELVQEWSEKGWQEPSEVTFKLSSLKRQTEIALTHKNVPDEEAADIAEGWREYYLGALKDYLEE